MPPIPEDEMREKSMNFVTVCLWVKKCKEKCDIYKERQKEFCHDGGVEPHQEDAEETRTGNEAGNNDKRCNPGEREGGRQER